MAAESSRKGNVDEWQRDVSGSESHALIHRRLSAWKVQESDTHAYQVKIALYNNCYMIMYVLL